MRTLCLDYGMKRIGVAISDPLDITAQPLPYISNSDSWLKDLAQVVNEYEVELIVLGLPKNQHGQDSPMAEHIREFAQEIESELNISIKFYDERLSSVQATKHLIESGVSRKKRKEVIDSLSASMVLQTYLDQQKNSVV